MISSYLGSVIQVWSTEEKITLEENGRRGGACEAGCLDDKPKDGPSHGAA